MQPRTPPAPPQPWADLPKVLDLAKRQNAVIKVSGACTLSREPYPFPDIWDPLARVFDAWGFDRCLWGTDWTRAFAVVNYEQAVEPFRQTDRLSDSERAMLMGGALRQGLWLVPEEELVVSRHNTTIRCGEKNHAESHDPDRGRPVRQRPHRPAGDGASAGRSHADAHRLRAPAPRRRTSAERFTDTFAYKDLKLTFTFSCYLIKHGDEYMVWDTGFAPGTNPNAPKVGIVDRLKEVNVTPEQVKYVGISHFHGDHTGQLAPFTNATLLIGKGDWDGITAPTPMQGANVAGFKSWIDEKQEGRAADRRQGRVRRRQRDRPQDAGPHAGPSAALLRQAEGNGPGAAHRRPRPLPRELRQSAACRASTSTAPQTVASIERMKQIVDEPEGDRRHPARHARHRPSCRRSRPPRSRGRGRERAMADLE